ncbi:MAG: hypothetical protein JWQ21_2043 [Herminiimonas sp.]|nr:hypothetical protein [Herminiimonas sp.]
MKFLFACSPFPRVIRIEACTIGLFFDADIYDGFPTPAIIANDHYFKYGGDGTVRPVSNRLHIFPRRPGNPS